LAELCKYIQIHLREPISLTQLASEADVSPAHLNRLFHAHFGTTAMRYVTRMRMESAREIIRLSPELPIKEVMLLTGYHQLPHFSRAFSQTYGLSPREFRKQQSKSL
jgi:transcriptional regulator GlxA family with amidase domain